MNSFFNRFSLNQRLAGGALLLGVLAVFAGDPYRGTAATIDTKELGLIVGNEVDHIAVNELADWIIQGKTDFRLIDLRSEKEFASYHIPQAENVPMASLADHGLRRNEKIVLYSEGGIHSAQAWFLLRARDFRGVYLLRGGLEEWKDQILFPSLAAGATSEQQAKFERRGQIAKFFGGTSKTGDAAVASVPSLEMPALVPPPSNATAKPAAGGKKKKEGC